MTSQMLKCHIKILNTYLNFNLYCLGYKTDTPGSKGYIPTIFPWPKRHKLYKGKEVCFVPGCANAKMKTRSLAVSYHRFPANEKRRRLWLAAIYGETNEPEGGWKMKVWQKVCSAHFVNGSFPVLFRHICRILPILSWLVHISTSI